MQMLLNIFIWVLEFTSITALWERWLVEYTKQQGDDWFPCLI